jgi:hypothetical protein
LISNLSFSHFIELIKLIADQAKIIDDNGCETFNYYILPTPTPTASNFPTPTPTLTPTPSPTSP